ncbi:MAG: glucose-6-phosphate isomerase, partial [Ignavibacteria bacterium]|nr:glucose-6-phosphate isomerase [Ignavibacteria bacterium]
MLKVNIENIFGFVPKDEIYSLEARVAEANSSIYNKTGKGSDFLGWAGLPSRTFADTAELKRINDCASRLAGLSDIIVVIGIGGSYLGARAVIDALSSNFNALLSKNERRAPLVLYAGNNIGEDYHTELLKVLDNADYSLIVISKSGTTTEPAIAFRLLKEHCEKKY